MLLTLPVFVYWSCWMNWYVHTIVFSHILSYLYSLEFRVAFIRNHVRLIISYMLLLLVGKGPCYSPFKKRPQPTYITHHHCRISWALMLTRVRQRQHVTVISFGSRASSLGYNEHATCFSRFLLTRCVLITTSCLIFFDTKLRTKWSSRGIPQSSLEN